MKPNAVPSRQSILECPFESVSFISCKQLGQGDCQSLVEQLQDGRKPLRSFKQYDDAKDVTVKNTGILHSINWRKKFGRSLETIKRLGTMFKNGSKRSGFIRDGEALSSIMESQ